MGYKIFTSNTAIGGRYFSHVVFFLIGLVLGWFITNQVSGIFAPRSCKNKVHTTTQENGGNYDSYDAKTSQVKVSSQRKLLYVGVMTANKFLNTRAKAIYETWGGDFPGEIGFFSSETSETSENIPLIKLKGIDDSYPPQRKSLTMLKYMHDNLLNDFEFFMRADDDIYVRYDRLAPLLTSINSSKLYFIGQSGQGAKEKIGKLHLDSRENYCMGGPGIIFSRATLAALGPHIDECIGNLKTTHEDVEVGRCVQKFVGIPCTWSFEMCLAFYHKYDKITEIEKWLKSRDLNQAITIHPIKNHEHMYILHSYILTQRIKEQEFELVKVVREISEHSKLHNLSLPDLDDSVAGIFVNHLGMEVNLQQYDISRDTDVPSWNFYKNKMSYSVDGMYPRHNQYPYDRETTQNTIREILKHVNSLSEERGREIIFKNILYSYSRHHPRYGAQFILDMLWTYMKLKGKMVKVSVRRHAYVQVPFGPLYIREITQDAVEQTQLSKSVDSLYSKMDKTSNLGVHERSENSNMVTLILPLSGRYERFKLFLENFQQVCIEGSSKAKLIIVHFGGRLNKEDTTEEVENEVSQFQRNYPSASIHLIKVDQPFSRGVGLSIGASATQSSDLLFFIDVDVKFNSLALDRIHLHTIRGRQVYFPIVYSEYDYKYLQENYDPDRDPFEITEGRGFWRWSGYGMLSIYHSDFTTVGVFNTNITGWGMEDIDFMEKVLKSPLHIFRAAEPSLVHIFHPVDCDTALEPEQFKSCEGSLRGVMGHRDTLAKYIFEKPEILDLKPKKEWLLVNALRVFLPKNKNIVKNP